jgi:transposase
MGADRTAPSARKAGRTATHHRPARCGGGDPLYRVERLSVVARQGIRRMAERGRMLPRDFPPVSTVQGYFYAWRDSGLWRGINHLLVMEAGELEGREASPSAGVIDSQSVKTTESGGVCGYDAPSRTIAMQSPAGQRVKRSRAASAIS